MFLNTFMTNYKVSESKYGCNCTLACDQGRI